MKKLILLPLLALFVLASCSDTSPENDKSKGHLNLLIQYEDISEVTYTRNTDIIILSELSQSILTRINEINSLSNRANINNDNLEYYSDLYWELYEELSIRNSNEALVTNGRTLNDGTLDIELESGRYYILVFGYKLVLSTVFSDLPNERYTYVQPPYILRESFYIYENQDTNLNFSFEVEHHGYNNSK